MDFSCKNRKRGIRLGVSGTWNWVFQALGTGCFRHLELGVSGTWNWVFQALELGVSGLETGCFRPWNWVFQALKLSFRAAGGILYAHPVRTNSLSFPGSRKIFRKPFLFGYTANDIEK